MKKYNVKDLGETEADIGWQILRNLDKSTLKIDQSAYIRDLLEEEDLPDCKSVTIPMKASSTIDVTIS